MENNELIEAVYRSRMRALGRRGGTATKARLSEDPDFFARIGARGGRAAASAARARIAAELAAADEPVATDLAPIVTPTGPVSTAKRQPQQGPTTVPMFATLDALMADLERP